MKPCEFEELYLFFTDQIAFVEQMLENAEALKPSIRKSLKSLKVQRKKLVENFLLSFPDVSQINTTNLSLRDADDAFNLLLKFPNLCKGIEKRLLLYLEYGEKMSGAESNLRYLLPLITSVLANQVICHYIFVNMVKSQEIRNFYLWLKSHDFKSKEVQVNVDRICQNVERIINENGA